MYCERLKNMFCESEGLIQDIYIESLLQIEKNNTFKRKYTYIFDICTIVDTKLIIKFAFIANPIKIPVYIFFLFFVSIIKIALCLI